MRSFYYTFQISKYDLKKKRQSTEFPLSAHVGLGTCYQKGHSLIFKSLSFQCANEYKPLVYNLYTSKVKGQFWCLSLHLSFTTLNSIGWLQDMEENNDFKQLLRKKCFIVSPYIEVSLYEKLTRKHEIFIFGLFVCESPHC